MNLSQHGSIIAISDPTKGVAVFIAPRDGELRDRDWLRAVAAHGVAALYTDWDYRETDSHAAWLLVTDPSKVG